MKMLATKNAKEQMQLLTLWIGMATNSETDCGVLHELLQFFSLLNERNLVQSSRSAREASLDKARKTKTSLLLEAKVESDEESFQELKKSLKAPVVERVKEKTPRQKSPELKSVPPRRRQAAPSIITVEDEGDDNFQQGDDPLVTYDAFTNSFSFNLDEEVKRKIQTHSLHLTKLTLAHWTLTHSTLPSERPLSKMMKVTKVAFFLTQKKV